MVDIVLFVHDLEHDLVQRQTEIGNEEVLANVLGTKKAADGAS